MILTCNSCNKKFVVPDSAITEAGRTVQCGACGNKWKQFPIKSKNEQVKAPKSPSKRIISRPKTIKKKVQKKTREISLYSPEYLAKKHGIKISDTDIKVSKSSKVKEKETVSFGFYSSLLVFIVIIIFISRSLYFSQSFLINMFPNLEFYLNYFFENIKNVFEIWKNLVSN